VGKNFSLNIHITASSIRAILALVVPRKKKRLNRQKTGDRHGRSHAIRKKGGEKREPPHRTSGKSQSLAANPQIPLQSDPVNKGGGMTKTQNSDVKPKVEYERSEKERPPPIRKTKSSINKLLARLGGTKTPSQLWKSCIGRIKDQVRSRTVVIEAGMFTPCARNKTSHRED